MSEGGAGRAKPSNALQAARAWPELADAHVATYSADGTLLAGITSSQLVVIDLLRKRRILACAVVGQRPAMAFHPSGDWLAVAGPTLGIVSLRTTPAWRDLFPGGRDASAPADSSGRQFINGHSAEWLRQRQAQLDETINDLQTAAESTETVPAAARQTAAARLAAGRAIDRQKYNRPMPAAARAVESVTAVAFSPDGRWLHCETTAGPRTFETDQLLREQASDVPKPNAIQG